MRRSQLTLIFSCASPSNRCDIWYFEGGGLEAHAENAVCLSVVVGYDAITPRVTHDGVVVMEAADGAWPTCVGIKSSAHVEVAWGSCCKWPGDFDATTDA